MLHPLSLAMKDFGSKNPFTPVDSELFDETGMLLDRFLNWKFTHPLVIIPEDTRNGLR